MVADQPFGRRVRDHRRTLDLNQEELANQVGCAPITIRKIESGDLRPSEQIAIRLAAALAIPPDERASFVAQARAVRPEPRIRVAPSSPPAIPDKAVADPRQPLRGYVIGPQIGAGGFGAVYVATQPGIEREVAVKVILPQYADHPDFIRRFEAEAQLVARLEHPHIVPLYDYWREPGAAYLVMRYLRGGSLYTLLERGPLGTTETLRILGQIGDGLSLAHHVGVAHRDLKPANILLDEQGNAYLADFGIAKDRTRQADLSFAGAFVGSPAYSSPEQLRAEPVTSQTDIYALGVLLFELLSGQRPFAGATPVLVAQQHLDTPVPSLALRRAGLPHTIDRVVQRAMAKVPSDRYGNIDEFLDELKAALAPAIVTDTLPVPAAAAPPTVVLDLSDSDNPYVGLRPFGEADAGGFFGRTALVQQILARMGESNELSRFLAIVGPSGSGKSSAVRAGLIPALRTGGLPGSEHWFVVVVTPGAAPLEQLAEGLRGIAPFGVEADDLCALLSTDSNGLLRAARLVLPPDAVTELILVIDQFEELFTLTGDEATRVHLLDSLVAATLDEGSQIRVVVTLRADFVDRPLQYVDFGELLRRRNELVGPLTADELEQAILGPARQAGLAMEAGLAAALITAVASQSGALPLLQHALSELFLRRQGRVLTRAAYAEIGGVSGAVAGSAEATYAGLRGDEQRFARQLFLRLVTPGEGGDDLRRRVRRSELAALGADAAVAAFGQARLLTFDRDAQTREPTVEVAHESLLRAWPRLRGWLEGAREELMVQRRLAQAAQEWQSAGREASYLAAGGRLAQFGSLAAGGSVALTQEEYAFVDASQKALEAAADAERARQDRELAQARTLAEEQRQHAEEQALAGQQLRRRAWFLAGALIIAVLAALAAGMFGIRSQQAQVEIESQRGTAVAEGQRAEQQAQVAQTAQNQTAAQLQIAESQRLAFAARSLSDGEAETALLLAYEAVARQQNTVTEQAFRESLDRLTWSPMALAGHTDQVTSAVFSPDGSRILTASADKTARLWDAQGQAITTLTGHTDQVTSAVFSPDGSRILTASDDKTARLWDAQGHSLATLTGHTDRVLRVVFSPDGSRILTNSSTDDHTARLWNAQGQLLTALVGHTDAVVSAVFSLDGSRILTGSTDKTARLWDLDGRPLATFTGHTAAVTGAVFSPDGTRVLTASADTTARVWDFQGQPLAPLIGHTGWVVSVVFSPDGTRILTSSTDGTARLWDPQGREIALLKGHTDWVVSAVFSPDGTRILTASFDKTVRMWDSQGQPITTWTFPERMSTAIFSPDGNRILMASEDRIARLWDIHGKELMLFKGHTDGITTLAFSPDGSRIATASNDTTVRLWDLQGHLLATISGHLAPVWSVAFSPDGSRILTGSIDNTARLWDLQGHEIAIFKGHPGPVYSAVFSPDGSHILTASADKTARLWDLQGREIASFKGHTEAVTNATFSPDGTRVVAASFDGTVLQYFVQLDNLLKVAVCRVGRGLTAEEIARFQVPIPLRFDFSTRRCPPALG